MNKLEAVQLRVDMINGQFETSAETTAFMRTVRAEIAAVAKRLSETAPETCDTGRFIAALDLLQQAKNVLCDSALLGGEASARKRRKSAE